MSSAPVSLHAGFTKHIPRPATPSKSDLACLRASNESHYRNVYVAGKDSLGRIRYVAKVKAGGRLRCLPGSRSTLPEESALAVVRWYERTFGAGWREALLARKRKPWRVWRSRARGGWCAAVWLYGRRVEVRRLRGRRRWHVRAEGPLAGRLVYRRFRESDAPLVFPSRAAARDGIRRFVAGLLNLRCTCAVWRTGQAPPEA